MKHRKNWQGKRKKKLTNGYNKYIKRDKNSPTTAMFCAWGTGKVKNKESVKQNRLPLDKSRGCVFK